MPHCCDSQLVNGRDVLPEFARLRKALVAEGACVGPLLVVNGRDVLPEFARHSKALVAEGALQRRRAGRDAAVAL